MRGPDPVLEPRYEELLHRVLDGEADASEAAELQAYLSRTPDAQAYFEDLQKLWRALGAIREVELPDGLQRDIMVGAQRQAASSGHRPQPRRRLVFADWFQPLRPRHAAIFGLGMAAGLALFALLFDGVFSSRHVAPGDGAASIGAARGARIDRQTLQIGGTAVDVETSVLGDRVTAELRVRALSSAEVVVQFDASALRLRGLERGGDAAVHQEAPGSSVAAEPGLVRLRLPGDPESTDTTYWLTWSRQADAAALHVALHVDGQRVERSLDAGSNRRP